MKNGKLKIILIPPGKLANSDEQLRKKREELKKKLKEGSKVVVEKSGNINPNDNSNTGNNIQIPPGKLADNDEQLRKKREELKKKLKEGSKVVVEKSGNINPNDNSNTGNNIQIPPGKLAFHWYEEKPKLLQEEISAMRNFFPQFKLDHLDDGRMFWHGVVMPEVSGNTQWYLQAIYDNNHPARNYFGGSVKVYSIEPDLEELVDDFFRIFDKPLPHIIKPPGTNMVFLCTSGIDDFKVDASVATTSAAGCITWAVKWIAAYELFLEGDITYEEFKGHII
jgi:hypothetical protein